MTTLQLNHCKFAAENSDLDKIVDYAMDKYVSPQHYGSSCINR